MPLPKTAKIGTQIYQIIERDPATDGGLTDALAYTLPQTNVIVLASNLPIQRQRSLLIHELLHALIYSFSRLDRSEKNDDFDQWEHYFIGIIQEPLTMLLRDNPALVTWLTAK